jgi:hypothetical protein
MISKYYHDASGKRITARYVRIGLLRSHPKYFCNGSHLCVLFCVFLWPLEAFFSFSLFFRHYSSHYAVNACLMPVLAADQCHVKTVEGIGNVGSGGNQDYPTQQDQQLLYPVQRLIVDVHGSQCGFCTPGIES